jgi:hypothetical protein
MPACHAGGRGFESRPFRKKAISFSGVAFFVIGPAEIFNFANYNITKFENFQNSVISIIQ